MKLSNLFRRDKPAPAAILGPPAPKPKSKRYAVTDADGVPTGFYHDDMHKVIPAGATEITEPQFQQLRMGQAASPMRRYRIVGGQLVPHNIEPSLADRARAAVHAGLTVSIDGVAMTFPAHAHAVARLTASFGSVAGSGLTRPMRDIEGTWRALSADQYRAVAAAVLSYAAALEMIADGNPLGAKDLPPSVVDLIT